jgi:hypothetical protein
MSGYAAQAAADTKTPGEGQQAAARDASAAAAKGADTGASRTSQPSPRTLSPHYDASRDVVLRFEAVDQRSVKVGDSEVQPASQPASQPAVEPV